MLASEIDPLHCHIERRSAAAPSLVQYADKKNADLIVMGTHGRRGIQHVLHGSVAEEAIRMAPCPVLTVRPIETESIKGEGSATASVNTSVERIVVPISFMLPSAGALQYAGRLASLYDVPIKLVHIVPFPTRPFSYDAGSPLVASHMRKYRAEQELQACGEALRDDGHRVTYVVHRGAPVPTILEAAPSPGDMLVMTTHGRSRMKRTVFGSITEEIIRRAQGPVLAARVFPTEEDHSETQLAHLENA